MKIDNFALTMYQTCPSKYDLRINQGWTPPRRSSALGFGGAIHEGLAAWHRGEGIGAALVAIDKAWPENHPVDDFRTREKCLQTMIQYSKKYPAETFKVVQGPSGPLIEVPFTLSTGMYLPCKLSWLKEKRARGELVGACPGLPLEDDTCNVCGNTCEPIEYGGIFDGVVEFSGSVYVLEHKSTSIMGGSYFNQFKPNNQVTGYCWAAGQMSGLPVGGAIINAIGVYKAGATKFDRHITGRFPEEIVEWLDNVYMVCVQLKTSELTNTWPKSTNACTLYGLCEFYSVHNLARESERQKLLEQQYIKDHWDYELRDGTEVTPNGN